MVVDLGAQFEALTNQNRRYRILQQYLVAALDAAEAHLAADFSANDVAYLKTRRALNVACEQARGRLARWGGCQVCTRPSTCLHDAGEFCAQCCPYEQAVRAAGEGRDGD